MQSFSGKKSRHFWRFGFDIFDKLLTNFKKLTWELQYINDQISEAATPKMVNRYDSSLPKELTSADLIVNICTAWGPSVRSWFINPRKT